MLAQTKHDNEVSRAIYKEYESLTDFIVDFEEPGERLSQVRVYRWIAAGQVPPEFAYRFAKRFGVTMEKIIAPRYQELLRKCTK